MSPQRLIKRWIASEHQYLGSPSPLMPVSHLLVPKCCSSWCLWNGAFVMSWQIFCHERTAWLLLWKKLKTKTQEWWGCLNPVYAVICALEPLKPPLMGSGLAFLFPYCKFYNYGFTQRCINSGVCGKPQKWRSVWKVKIGQNLRSKYKLM